MNVIVTSGPAYAPIDEVRRITNFSSGQLGDLLAAGLEGSGHDVTCFRGYYATHPLAATGADIRTFTTNEDLFRQLSSVPDRNMVGALFHAAALCDYEVAQICDASGTEMTERKVPSRSGKLTLTLTPALKLISKLRDLFPNAIIVGWKYELDGSREDAISKGLRQIRENRTTACVVNGAAYGQGFGFCQPEAAPVDLGGKNELVEFIINWLAQTRK